MKKSIITLAFLLCAVAVFGQNKLEVVHLKNGSVVKGAVVGEKNDSIAVQASDGSVFIFATNDITQRVDYLCPKLKDSIVLNQDYTQNE